MSGLKTRPLGLNTLGTTLFPTSSQSVLVSSLSWKIVMGPRFRVSSERLEKPGIEPTTPVLEGEQLNHYATEASLRKVFENIITYVLVNLNMYLPRNI